jgi:hypothetical protein
LALKVWDTIPSITWRFSSLAATNETFVENVRVHYQAIKEPISGS